MSATELEFLRWAAGMLVAGLCAVLWWNFRGLAAVNRALSQELAAHKLYVANNYAKHADLEKTASQFERVAERIEAKLDQLFIRLDSKADKP